MNTAVVLQILGLVETYAPKVLSVITEAPDIVSKTTDAISKLKTANVSGAVTDFEGILKDIGLSTEGLTKTLAGARAMGPTAPAAIH